MPKSDLAGLAEHGRVAADADPSVPFPTLEVVEHPFHVKVCRVELPTVFIKARVCGGPGAPIAGLCRQLLSLHEHCVLQPFLQFPDILAGWRVNPPSGGALRALHLCVGLGAPCRIVADGYAMCHQPKRQRCQRLTGRVSERPAIVDPEPSYEAPLPQNFQDGLSHVLKWHLVNPWIGGKSGHRGCSRYVRP